MRYSDEQITDAVSKTPGNRLKNLPEEILSDERFLNSISHAQFMSLARAHSDHLTSRVTRTLQSAMKRRAETEPAIRFLLESRDRFPEPERWFYYV